ncbi:MAG: serine protease [Oscillospiraceae bacterium]|nr:serine protease [Oscillospiraceae bacterium]
MKKITALLVTIAIMSGILAGCNESVPESSNNPASSANSANTTTAANSENSTNSTNSENSTNEACVVDPLTNFEKEDLIPALADLTVDIFKRSFMEKSDENNLVSPLSALIALNMVMGGAAGDTYSEMLSSVALDINPAYAPARILSSYFNNLPSEDGSKLNIANSVWFRDDDSFVVEESFLKYNREWFNAEIRKAAFDAGTVKDINAWVEEYTDGMIDEIIDEISDTAVMYLINAIAFDSEWEEQYTDKDVSKRDFYPNGYDDEKRQSAEFMYSTEEKYIETENATGFLKPYKGGHYSFAALLPNEEVDITDFVADMTGTGLINALNSVTDEEVNAFIPKFTFDYEIVMNDLLCDMGMKSAFDPDLADFSNLGKSDLGNLYINRVLHKTFIEVDEKGTKAAAVTSVEMNSYGVSMTKSVNLDRPFVFAIVDNDTGVPVFMGVLMSVDN